MNTEQQERPDRQTSGQARIVLVAILAGLSVVAAVVSTVSWAVASSDAGAATARTREVVLRQAERRLVEMNTIDHEQAVACLDRWQRQVTGALADEVRRNREGNIKAIRESRTTTTSRALALAVTGLDVHNGRANLIAALELEVSTEGTPPATKRSRVNAQLTRTEHGWKLSGVQVVGLSG